MKTVEEIEAGRDKILEQMREIRSMERGSINEYYVPVKHKGEKEPVRKGPYYVISRRGEKKTEGRQLKSKQELERAQQDVEACGKFKELCKKYEELTEELGRMERSLGESSLKKNS